MLTVDEVKKKVDHIREIAGDDEAAHAAEDALFITVLSSIASGHCADPAACAAVALTTSDISFARWYA